MARDDYAYLQTDTDRYFSTVSLAQLEALDGHGFFPRAPRLTTIGEPVHGRGDRACAGGMLLSLNGVEEKIPSAPTVASPPEEGPWPVIAAGWARNKSVSGGPKGAGLFAHQIRKALGRVARVCRFARNLRANLLATERVEGVYAEEVRKVRSGKPVRYLLCCSSYHLRL